MRRPNYSAVTGVLTAMSLTAFVRVALLHTIPEPNPEIAQWGRGEFVTRASREDIPWRPLGPKAFAEARALSRPIFLVVGVPWSAAGRRADETLALPEVARILNRGFVPIRVDAAQNPNWISEILPFSRARLGVGVGFQAWVFDVRGNLIDAMGQIDAPALPDGRTLGDALVNAQSLFATSAQNDTIPTLEASQREDARRLLDLTVGDFSLPLAATALGGSSVASFGGWAEASGVAEGRPAILDRPLAVRFLQLAGRSDEAESLLRATALSSRTDWLDGGLYRLLRIDTRTPDYDKVAVTNAQFAEDLAVQDAVRPLPLFRTTATATVEWLLGLRDDGLVAAAEQGDEDELGRSERASFSAGRLRSGVDSGTLSVPSRDWALEHLRLDDPSNPARLPIARGEEDDGGSLGKTLKALRAVAGPRRPRVEAGLIDVNGAVAASLLRCARLWNDPRLAGIAGTIVDRLETCRDAQNEVRHAINRPKADGAYLSDALGYADANLEDFFANGRVPSLERGAAVLRRALVRFRGDDRGTLRPSPAGDEVFAHHPSLAQVDDDESEASSAMALRLLLAYGAVLGASGDDLNGVAASVAEHLTAVAVATPAMGGSLAALERYADPRALFVVGVDAVASANRLARRFPNRLVIPVVGPVRSELAHRPPGIYLGASAAATGPWSEVEVASQFAGSP